MDGNVAATWIWWHWNDDVRHSASQLQWDHVFCTTLRMYISDYIPCFSVCHSLYLSMCEGLKSPLPLWLGDITESNYSQEASVLPIIRRLHNVERTDFRSSSNIGRCQYLDG